MNWTTLAPRLNTGRIANVVIVTTDLKRKASEMASPAPTEAEELAALNKALTALGFTDDVKLERFLHVLMPRVIDQMASKHESTKRKVLFEVDKAVTRNRRGHTHPANPTPVDESNPHVQAARERQTKYVIRNAARKVEREGGSHSEL